MADAARVREVGAVSKTTFNKAGNATARTDGLGNETISLYDNLDRLTTVYEPLRDPAVSRKTGQNYLFWSIGDFRCRGRANIMGLIFVAFGILYFPSVK